MKNRHTIFFLLFVNIAFAFSLQAQALPQGYEDLTVELEEKLELSDLSSIVGNNPDMESLEAKAKKNYSGETSEKRQTHSYNKNLGKKEVEKRKTSWKPQFGEKDNYQPNKSFLFRTDIGLGLLYFSGVNGRFVGQPNALFSNRVTNTTLSGKLGYNRTPVYDFMFGYRFCPWLQVGLNYTHQGNVTVYTANLPTQLAIAGFLGSTTFSSNVNLDALSVRVYTDGPWPLFWRNMILNGYIGTGVGVGWQTWTNNLLLSTIENTASGYNSVSLLFRQKVSTNVFWGADVGFRFRSLASSSHFSLSAGMKFNLWGQATNIGEISQQGSYKYGITSPFRIRTLYQWAPYLSVQWNFPNGNTLNTKLHKKSQMSPMLTQMNVGVGILRFKNIQGNLIGIPNQNGLTNGGWQTARVTQNISYNKTPLYEFLLQHRFNDYTQIGLSYQNQGGVVVRTEAVPTQANPASMIGDTALLNAYLNLNSILLKGYLLFPIFPKSRNLNITPYFGLGFGPSWQTWSRIGVYTTSFSSVNGGMVTGVRPVRQKILANVMLGLDWGIKLTSLHEKNYFSLVAGCKYNYWGQTRNIGQQNQQGSFSTGLNAPFKIQRVYQWAPYLGVQWNFPNNYYGNKPFFVEGRSPSIWKPFRVDMDSIQKSKGVFTQMNVGLGLLYFRGVKGNISGVPAAVYAPLSSNIPLKGRLTYNRTPLFEYQVGYRFCPLLKASLSYQHQGNVTVQTKVLRNIGPTTRTTVIQNQQAQFNADVVLDAVMVKAYTEYPRAYIWRNMATTAYIGAGVGPAWQTWKHLILNQPFVGSGELNSMQTSFRQRISANLAFMVDTGLRIQSPYPNTGFSALFGFKFNFWGQACSMGNLQDQPTLKHGLAEPVRVLTVYQWAPYLGVQWNF